MPRTSRSAWKQRERDAAGLFGAKRQPGSGSGGRDDLTRSDSTHPTLYVETKLRASHAVVTLFDQTRTLARRENKVAVLALAVKHRPGLVLVVAPEDLAEVARRYQAARPDEPPAPEPPPKRAKPKPPQSPTLFDLD